MADHYPRFIRSSSSEFHGTGSFFERLAVMVKPTLKVIGSWPMFIAMAVWLTFYATVNLWPASSWLEVDRVSIGNTLAGQPVPIIATRSINRPFSGDWRVTVRRWEYNGWVVYCNASGSNNYKTEAILPANLTLAWWTDGQCPVLPEGRYVANTSWRIQPNLPFLPAKYVAVDSNIFEVAK